MPDFSEINFTLLIDHLGTFAFAISGIRSASEKSIDWFGVYVVGLVTAIGGGTIRDLLLGATPFWMQQPSYLIITGLALLSVLLFSQKINRLSKTVFLFDTIGLGLFVVIGIEKSLAFGFPFWVSITMGMISGCAGGVIRDVLLNEVPLLFRRDIYALACVAGGFAYLLCSYLHASIPITNLIAAGTVIAIRLIAVTYHVQIPTLKPHNE